MRLIPRSAKFWIINTLLLPAGVLLLRALVASWRLSPESLTLIEKACAVSRLAFIVYHGHSMQFLSAVAFAKRHGRRLSVMTSPSRDGLVLDRILGAFGLEVIKGSSKSRAAAGAIAMIRQIERGVIGIIAADGPRGPIGRLKPGFFAIAQSADATLAYALLRASHAITLRSWDRMVIPLPFARIELEIVEVPLISGEDGAAAALRVETMMLEHARRSSIPVFKDLPIRDGKS